MRRPDKDADRATSSSPHEGSIQNCAHLVFLIKDISSLELYASSVLIIQCSVLEVGVMIEGRGKEKFGFPRIVTWRTAFLIVLCLLLMVSLLYAAERVPDAHPVFRRIIQSLAAIILTSGIISIASNLLVHKELADFWLDAVGIRESLQLAGLVQIGLDFQDFDFRKHLQATNEIDILVIYASTWLKQHINDLKEFLSKPRNHMRVCVLNESSSCVPSFAESFGMKS